MLQNCLTIVWRNLTWNKGYSLIKISRLVIGIAVYLFINLWIHDELTQPDYNYNHTQITQHDWFKGRREIIKQSAPMLLNVKLRDVHKDSFAHITSSQKVDSITANPDMKPMLSVR